VQTTRRLNAWRVDDNTTFVVVDELYTVKLIGDPSNPKAARIHIAVDDPIVDPRWGDRVDVELTEQQQKAVTRARYALYEALAKIEATDEDYGPDAAAPDSLSGPG
jgi:hypothetical protein